MRPNYTYCIVEAAGGIFEVWGKNPATGYEWLIAEYDTREQARCYAGRCPAVGGAV